MNIRRALPKILLSLCVIALSAADPALAKSAISGALEKWAHEIVPALLPFLLAVPALTCSEAYALLSGITRPLMRLIGCPNALGAAWLSGALAGSPAGALAAVRAAENADCDEGALLRVSIAASGASPAFLLSVAGAALGGGAFGRLWLAQTLGGLCTARLMRPLRGGALRKNSSESNGSAVMSAVRALVMIAVCMALFALPAAWGAHLLGERARAALMMLLELTSGCSAAAALDTGAPLKAALMSAVCCFGGASVCAQSLAALKLPAAGCARYVYWKLVHAAFSALIALALTQLPLSAATLHIGADAFIALPGALAFALGAAYWLNKRRLKGAGKI